MGKQSELIGEVIDGKLKHNRTIGDEEFDTILVSFKGTQIPVLFSHFVNSTDFENGSKLKITGCLISDIAEGKLPVFYFYANSIELADLDAETTNEINFSCTVTKVREFQSNSRCIDILPLVAADGSPLNTTSVLYLCARMQAARKLRNKEKGYTIVGRGYLKQFRDIYEILITKVENLDELQ
jgi:hypothetical protein